jgi:excinuclease UvrABC ATPase subunit
MEIRHSGKRQKGKRKSIVLKGANGNNLKNVSLELAAWASWWW